MAKEDGRILFDCHKNVPRDAGEFYFTRGAERLLFTDDNIGRGKVPYDQALLSFVSPSSLTASLLEGTVDLRWSTYSVILLSCLLIR